MSKAGSAEEQPSHPEETRRSTGRWIGAVLVLLAVAVILVLWAYSHLSEGIRRARCRGHLKQIGLALHNYHDMYGSYPPAYIPDENGRPMHSWRVLILPFLGQDALYNKYRFDEPWDGPNNSKLADETLYVYQCPAKTGGDASVMTSYVVVVGPNTVWPGSEPVSISEITDGTANTICIVEVADSVIHWMEPRDLHLNQMSRTINPESGQGISSEHEEGAHAALCDGSVRFLSEEEITPDLLRRLLERNDGEPVEDF